MRQADTLVFDPLFPTRPWTVCFYSYRGGVGRSTLAVNTSFYITAGWNYGADMWHSEVEGELEEEPDSSHAVPSARRVILIDFDLEAPSLDSFVSLRPTEKNQKGLVEYVRSYLENWGKAADGTRISDYVYSANVESILQEAREHGGLFGDSKHLERGFFSIFVMRAGRRDSDYRRFLGTHNWSSFYQEKEGFLFFENMRSAISTEFGCSYCILDSRTGLSDIGGICTGHLADAYVLVFHPSAGHDGLVDLVSSIRDREKREERPFPRLYVASKVHLSDNDYSPPSVIAAERLVRQCEGENLEVVFWDGVHVEPCNVEGLFPEPGRANLLFVPLRVGLANPDKLDSLLSPVPSAKTLFWDKCWWMLASWVKASRRHVAERLKVRS